MITAFYAALLGLFFTVLTLRVLALRGVTPLKWLAFNNFGAQALERSVRAHATLLICPNGFADDVFRRGRGALSAAASHHRDNAFAGACHARDLLWVSRV